MNKVAGIITMKERRMLRDYILLPYIETMIKRSMANIENSTDVLRRLYLAAALRILSDVSRDKVRLKRELKSRKIQITEEISSELVQYYDIVCRGYTERFGLTRDVMRSEISLRLTQYVAQVNALLNEEKAPSSQINGASRYF
ncbi:hypothetical protein DFP94_101526 [Fontibacillus phaseoli]|uniref:Uncharacterized protein n=1 Tax=Fontibacillus phaseoli TaxID=1416533 RepID=A0A369BR50_9BACL|nr:hypothetical protein [Fontibacillus phaseoli]RCX22937.1 hypothetical protein DFP94_101526 [Fontibacillus phaseoli]